MAMRRSMQEILASLDVKFSYHVKCIGKLMVKNGHGYIVNGQNDIEVVVHP